MIRLLVEAGAIPAVPAMIGVVAFIVIAAITFLAAWTFHSGELEIEAAHALHRLDAISDDTGLDYDPAIARARLADEEAPPPGTYLNWHEYDLWNKRPIAFSTAWWVLMRRLSREDTQCGRYCHGYEHFHVTADKAGGYILYASPSYREVVREVVRETAGASTVTTAGEVA